MGKNTRILDETGNHASRERKTDINTIIHKSLLSDYKDRSLHNFTMKNNNISLTNEYLHMLCTNLKINFLLRIIIIDASQFDSNFIPFFIFDLLALVCAVVQFHPHYSQNDLFFVF